MTFNFHDGEAILHMLPRNWGHGQYCKASSVA